MHGIEASLEVERALGCESARGVLRGCLGRFRDGERMHGVEAGLEGIDAGSKVLRVVIWWVALWDGGVGRALKGIGSIHAGDGIGAVGRYDVLVLGSDPQ